MCPVDTIRQSCWRFYLLCLVLDNNNRLTILPVTSLRLIWSKSHWALVLDISQCLSCSYVLTVWCLFSFQASSKTLLIQDRKCVTLLPKMTLRIPWKISSRPVIIPFFIMTFLRYVVYIYMMSCRVLTAKYTDAWFIYWGSTICRTVVLCAHLSMRSVSCCCSL